MVELLIEWHKGARVRTVDYVGLRVLPLVVKVDAEVLALYKDLSQLLWPANGERRRRDRRVHDAPHARSAGAPSARRAVGSCCAAMLDGGGEADEGGGDGSGGGGGAESDADTLLHSLVMFPLRVKLCVGNNSLGWPVIADEANILMSKFTRANVFGDRLRLASQLMGRVRAGRLDRGVQDHRVV
jgi:hypothetical protein